MQIVLGKCKNPHFPICLLWSSLSGFFTTYTIQVYQYIDTSIVLSKYTFLSLFRDSGNTFTKIKIIAQTKMYPLVVDLIAPEI